jgi:hypothetical protein
MAIAQRARCDASSTTPDSFFTEDRYQILLVIQTSVGIVAQHAGRNVTVVIHILMKFFTQSSL